MANASLNQQGSTTPVAGGYVQPATGITGAYVAPGDASGNLYATGPAASGLAPLQTAAYRDSVVTVQAGSHASAPSAGGTVVAVTPGTAGKWEVTGLVGITGTTVGTVDTNNMALNQGATAVIAAITYPVQATTGSSTQGVIPATVLNLAASDVVSVTAVANSTGSSVYSATLVARRVG